MMHRTQVYFDKETLQLLRAEAREKRTTLAAVIREKVKKTLPKKARKKKKKVKTQMNAAEALLKIAELGEKLNIHGPKDLSQRIDEFVYKT